MDNLTLAKSPAPVEVELHTDGVRKFLQSSGLEDLVPVLVDKHKFEETKDLRLLAKNSELVKSLELPLCSVLKLTEALSSLNKVEDEKTSVKSPEKEILKKDLLELCKNNLSAQAANHAYNKFNNIINKNVKKFFSESKRPVVKPFFFSWWHGSGGLKVCKGTSKQEAKPNLELCNNIIEDDELQALYGVYRINGEGIVTLDKSKAKRHISGIMCSQRKPSAYKSQAPKKGSDTKKRALRSKNSKEEPQEKVPKKAPKVSTSIKETQENIPEEDLTVHTSVEEADGHRSLNDSGIADDDEQNQSHKVTEVSEYEKKRLENLQANELKLLTSGFVPRDQAVIVGLHYLKARTVTSANVQKLKSACRQYCISYSSKSTKEDLLRSLGQVLFEKKIVKRKNELETITHDNLCM